MNEPETLRSAATLMRENAEGAVESLYGSWDWTGIGTGYREPIKQHISSWPPAVAVVVADWLDSVAAAFTPPDESRGRTLNGRSICHVDERAALAIARAYLDGIGVTGNE